MLFDNIYIKNGFHIPLVFLALVNFTQNIYISGIITLKLYPANYFYWFGNCYNFFPQSQYNCIKQFIRFTDTGHIASFIYFFYPAFFPIAYNIHFVITAGYWSGKLLLNIEDADEIHRDDIISWFSNIWTYMVHGMPFLLLLRDFYYNNVHNDMTCNNYFTDSDLYYSYAWVYVWFLCIYLPWRICTGDIVYSVLSFDTPINKQFAFILLMHVLFLIANWSGHFITNFQNHIDYFSS